LALGGGEWAASHLEERAPSTPWIGGWLDPRASLDVVAKKKKSIVAPRRNLTPVIQHVA